MRGETGISFAFNQNFSAWFRRMNPEIILISVLLARAVLADQTMNFPAGDAESTYLRAVRRQNAY
jgi:hypothetical protein